MNHRKRKPNPPVDAAPPTSGRKLWRFRLMAMIGVPLLFFGVLELGLRLAGFGHPTGFLLKSSNHGQETFIQNDQFGWRFFGPRASRVPAPISIPRQKPPNTIRVVVFGESAALGDPQPRFGLPRLLQAILDLRHPDKKFELVNGAMTGINSHVILPLARDCATASGDAWVIYMGNNEVVGPFGPGTVFGKQTMPLPLIRTELALKATRIGQWFDTLQGATQRTTGGGGEWEGMRMFVNYKLAGFDLRLESVYHNFGQNLKDIIAAGQNHGAKIVLSTVGVNVRDCAPFASLHRSDVAGSQLDEWQRLFDAGVKAEKSGDFRQAATDYDQAARLDDGFAELRFRRGQCALALQDTVTAQKELAAARDLDALRFRCDSQLNNIIRRQAVGGIALADGERALAEASPGGIPGDEVFYEHVHLTFEGNYALARAIAEQLEKALGLSDGAPWPDIAHCAQRLGRTPRDIQAALTVLFGRMDSVPFTYQANHEEQMRRLAEIARELPPPNSEESLRGAQSAAESALARWSDDAELWDQLGEIKQAEGDYAGAVAATKRSLDLTPSSDECWLHYGILLAQQEKYEDAIAAFEHELALDPRAVWARHNLAQCLEKLNRRDEAVTEFKRTLLLKPDYGTAWLALGQLYEKMGRTNDSEQCYTTALTNRVNRVDDLAELARFCFNHRWYGHAVTNFEAAIELSPSDARLRMQSGRALAAFGRHDDAVKQYQVAAELQPGQAQPHMQVGFELGRLNKPALAEQEFRQALRIDSSLMEARVDLGIALYEQNKREDALQQFEDVLQRNPKDATALRYVQSLRNRAPLPAPQ